MKGGKGTSWGWVEASEQEGFNRVGASPVTGGTGGVCN